jgi:hypothetical protein
MNFQAKSRIPLLLLLLGSLATAQTEPKKAGAQAEPKKAGAQAEPKKAATPAAAPKAVPASTGHDMPIKLDLKVTGLTKDNMSKVKDGLTALTYPAFTCAACQVEKSMAGKCPKCSGDLKAEKKPMFTSVATTDTNVALTFAPSHRMKLSEIESALRTDSVTVDESAVPIPGPAELVLKGGTADNVASIQKALEDAKLFDEVHAMWDAGSSEIHVTARGTNSPTRGKVEAAVQSLKVHVSDVIYGHPAMKA